MSSYEQMYHSPINEGHGWPLFELRRQKALRTAFNVELAAVSGISGENMNPYVVQDGDTDIYMVCS